MTETDHAAGVPIPVRFTPEMEQHTPDEPQTEAGLIKTLEGISRTVLKDSGHAFRSVHAKGHGLLRGELRVLDNLPAALAQGMFAQAGTYPAIMRLSTIPGDVLDDGISTPRGCAVKIVGVPGTRLPGSEADTTQDFVMANAPTFGAPTAKAFLGNLKLLAATTDRLPGLKKAFSRAARATEGLIETLGRKSALLSTLGGQPATHILGETFFSQAALLYGPYVVKVCLAPVSPGLIALTGKKIDLGATPTALREAVRAHFAAQGGEWELRVQLCTDLEKMPIENASIDWPRKISPYLAVAVLSMKPQDSWSEEAVRDIDEGMSFSPWHGVADHRPLGNVMRARRATYSASAAFRATHNGCLVGEPRG